MTPRPAIPLLCAVLLSTTAALAQQQPVVRLAELPAEANWQVALREPISEPVPPPLEDPHWTLAELESLALANHPALAMAYRQVEVARGRWVQAGLKPNPTVGYSGEEIGNEGSAGLQGAYVGQTFLLGGKLSAAQAEAAAAVSQAEQQWAITQQRVLTDVRTQFDLLLIAEQRTQWTGQIAKITQAALETTDTQFNAKQVARVDVMQARIEAGQARITSAEAQNRRDAQWRRLVAAVGLPDLPYRALAGEASGVAPQLEWEDALAGLLSASPELAEAHAGVAHARRAMATAEAQAVPNLDGQLGVHYDDETNYTIAGVQLEMPLPVWNRNQGNRQAAAEQWRAAQANVQRVELRLAQQLAEEFRLYDNARYQVMQYEQSIIPDAFEALQLVESTYPVERGFLELLTAQRTYFMCRLNWLEALEQQAVARRRIEGFLLDGALQEGL